MRLRLSLHCALISASLVTAQGTPADYERSARLFALTRDKVFRTTVEPHWFDGGKRFWYRVDLPPKARGFFVVDVETGERDPAFDHSKLAVALEKAAGKDAPITHLPFDTIEIEGPKVRFTAFGQMWVFDRKSESVVAAPGSPKRERGPMPREVRPRQRGPRGQNPWTVTVRDNNIFLRKADVPEFQLTKDGTADDSYSWREISWSPDFTKLVALRTKKADPRIVTIVESSPRDQLQPRVVTYPYPKPGDKLPVAKPHLFDLASRTEIPVPDGLFPNPWELRPPNWLPDGSAFRFVYNQRGHQVLRLIEVDAKTGKPRALINEESKTFIDYAHKQYLHEVESTNELIWMSERDGWNHLYLIDGKTGAVKNQITKGEWVVRGVDRVDEEKRQIWFRAGGIHPEQDPYYVHYCRVNFDGTGLVKLTDDDGTHSVRYSPDGKYLIDTYSRVDMAPVTELRRVEDGAFVCALEFGDTSALEKTGWRAPERFVAKGRDGTTDIYGVIFRPTNFDPNKKYPVIEQIYAGPQGSFVPKAFAPFYRPQELAELGFILVQIDGMGTSNRSKAFHDVCWHNLGDAGLPDRILWMKAAAAKYPQLDLTRVGVYGGSAGGQNALGAVLTHGEFYKVAAADCGCHDNRMDKVWWNELWMGYPVGPHYAEQSNVTLAHRLTGKLLLTVGEVDRNVDPASTMQVVNALIKAGKDFELIVVPGGGHGSGNMPYGNRRRQDFFVRHLLGVEPPDRNNPPRAETKTEPTKESPKADAKTGPSVDTPKAEPKKSPPPEVPDLAALVAKPQSEVRPLVRMYEADQGALRRKYNLPTTEADCARLRKFYSDWSTAVDKIEVASLSNVGVDDLAELRKRIEKDRKELEDAYLNSAEVAPLLPFAPKIVALELARRKLEPFDPLKLAGRLDELRKEIDKARKAAADPKGHDLPDVYLSKPAVEKAAAVVTELRGVFKYWHDFYAGYDPMFTWWTAQPAKDVDTTLDRLAKLLKEKAPGAPAHTGPLRMVPLPRWDDGPSDIPDPKALIRTPSEMAGVIQRYQADFFGRGQFPALPTLTQEERRERQTRQVQAWLAALGKIDFDQLSHEGQIDYLLVRNGLRREQNRVKEPPTDGPRRRPRDSDEIVGRPIGREALLAALAAEMIPYSPEQLVEMANREYAWCEAEMNKAAREMGCGDDWKAAVEKVKTLHVAPGGQPRLVRDLALEAIDYVRSKDLVTVPPLAAESWRMDMMTPERQRFNPFFTGGEIISVAFPTDTMTHEQKLQALRGNNIHFSRATVHHELIPGHHLQQFMTQRYQPQRQPFGTPFWTEGWAVYWEMVLYEKGFPRGPEDRVGLLFWRMHRCARVIFSLGFHLGKMTPQDCIDFLVDKVGHERENATAEVRRSFQGGYPPLYQAGYLVGAKQFWALRQELVTSGKMTEKAFHDAILKHGIMPVELVRAAITDQKLSRDFTPSWEFLGDLPAAEWPKR